MASIRSRGNNHQVRWRQDGTSHSETFSTKAAATKFRGLVDAAGQRYPEGWIPGHGFGKSAQGLTLDEWYRRSVAARPGANARTKADYLRYLELHIPRWLRDRPVAAITREDAGLWLAEVQSTMKPKTLLNIHAALSSVMNDAVTNDHAGRNPFRGIVSGIDSHPEDEMVVLTTPEWQQVRAGIVQHYQPFVDVLYSSGLRFGEATALGPEHVDIGKRLLRVRRAWKRGPDGYYLGPPKTRRSRRDVSISGELADRLEPLLQGDLVFANLDGERIKHGTFYDEHWVRAVRKAQEAGLKKRPRLHDLRHTHASVLLDAGVSMMVVSRRLGHSSIMVTDQRYAHLMPDSDDGVRSVLDRL